MKISHNLNLPSKSYFFGCLISIFRPYSLEQCAQIGNQKSYKISLYLKNFNGEIVS